MTDCLYEDRGEFLRATEFTRGPWAPDAQHGGPVAAILMRAFERCDPAQHGGGDMQITRLTCELLKPVPLGDLRVDAQVLRPGRRVQLLGGAVSTPDGIEVARATAVRVQRAPVPAGGNTAPPAGLQTSKPQPFFAAWSPKFPGDGIEIRFASGGFLQPGPAVAWFRLAVPLVSGEQTSPLQRLATAADFPNGISSELRFDEFVFINPDLTLYVEREPRGEWICLDASMRINEGGGAVSEAVLYDLEGRVGRSLQSLYVASRLR